MGFLKGKTKTISGTPQELQPLRGNIASQLNSGIGGQALGQAYQGVLGQGAPPAQDMRFFYENLLKPYQDLFASQRGDALAAGKESAGNLTGSGYNNILGSSLAGSLAGEQAQTAQTLMGLRQQELQRQQAFMQMLMGFASSGVGPPQTVYQPGLLDSLLPGLGQLGGQWLAGRGQGGGGQPQGPAIPQLSPTGVQGIIPGAPTGFQPVNMYPRY